MNILNDNNYGYISEDEFISRAEQCREIYETIDFKLSSGAEINNQQDEALKANENVDKAQGEEIEDLQSQLVSLVNTVSMLETKINDMTKNNVQTLTEFPTTSDITADFEVNGAILLEQNTIKCKTISLNDVKTNGDDNRLNITSNEVSINGMTASGTYTKSKGNAVVVINNAQYVTVKDSIFDTTGYNGFEIALNAVATKTPKVITFDNCTFGEGMSNNIITLYKSMDNAVINITNCTFKGVGNILRLSNATNARGLVVNFTNCIIEKWLGDSTEYRGLVLLQDYTSKTVEAANANNLFGEGKITINFTNITTPDGKLNPVDDLGTILGSKNEKQIAYVYKDAEKFVAPYDSNIYPIVNIK